MFPVTSNLTTTFLCVVLYQLGSQQRRQNIDVPTFQLISSNAIGTQQKTILGAGRLCKECCPKILRTRIFSNLNFTATCRQDKDSSVANIIADWEVNMYLLCILTSYQAITSSGIAYHKWQHIWLCCSFLMNQPPSVAETNNIIMSCLYGVKTIMKF